MHFLVRTTADAGRSPKLPPDQADEFAGATVRAEDLAGLR
jgi:hypothetical protein